MKREPQFKTEADLCTAFQAWVALFDGWTCYAETEGWDILLAHADGTQIGIQAKLKFNIKVLAQTIESGHGWQETGPDFRAVLVPDGAGFRDLANALGITTFNAVASSKYFRRPDDIRRSAFQPDITSRHFAADGRWHYCNPAKRHALPKYVPDVPAGVSGPCSLTRWKIGALEIAATIELRGYVTRQDFRRASIDHRRWVESWLEPADIAGVPGAWRWRDGVVQPFQTQHPEVYPQVLSDVDRWLQGVAV